MNLRSFGADASGNIAILFAMAFAVAAVLGAVAVDAASLYHERRMVQNGVDMAALSAASDVAQASSIASSSLVHAGLLDAGSTAGLTVTPGRYDPDPNTPVEDRFKPGVSPLNAVRVSLERQGQLHFAQDWAPSPMISASAIATVTPQVSFSIGSRSPTSRSVLPALEWNGLPIHTAAGLEAGLIEMIQPTWNKMGVPQKSQ